MIVLGGAATLVVKVTLVLPLGLMLLRLAARQSAACRHAIAATTLVAAATVPLALTWLPSVPVMVEVARGGAAGHRPHGRTERAHPAVAPRTSGIGASKVSSLLWAVWAAGAALCLLPALAMALQSRRLRREGQALRK